ncbi:MAG: type 1 glutamine amidotransferase [Gallionella sp.]
MKPIAIFRFSATEGPGYFAEFLDQHELDRELIYLDTGDIVPGHAAAYSGLAFMGGPMSVNDELPWITPVLALIRNAMALDIPLLGHCLGGQLISKALGVAVTRNPVKELGWGEVVVSNNQIARDWFGDVHRFPAFHWHGETFALPKGATHLLSSQHCANQAYAVGKHLALQCHVEMTAEMISTWCEAGADEIAAASGPAVQQASQMRDQMRDHLPTMRLVATVLYTRWIKGLQT